LRIGNPDSAFADYNEALRLAPRYVEIYVFRGTAYADVGKFKEAIDDFTQAISINPTFITAYDRRASCYFEIHRYKEALADVEYIMQNGYQIDAAFVQEVRKKAAGN
jgi:tetratricopeptide (TPR) repeat protein